MTKIKTHTHHWMWSVLEYNKAPQTPPTNKSFSSTGCSHSVKGLTWAPHFLLYIQLFRDFEIQDTDLHTHTEPVRFMKDFFVCFDSYKCGVEWDFLKKTQKKPTGKLSVPVTLQMNHFPCCAFHPRGRIRYWSWFWNSILTYDSLTQSPLLQHEPVASHLA